MAEFYEPEQGEVIEECIMVGADPWDLPMCQQCAQVGFRVLTISTRDQQKRKVALCGRHFISACIRHPELEKFSRRGKMG